jgi:hypothetical protein
VRLQFLFLFRKPQVVGSPEGTPSEKSNHQLNGSAVLIISGYAAGRGFYTKVRSTSGEKIPSSTLGKNYDYLSAVERFFYL